MMPIFTLTSARSGTFFLRCLFQNNVKDCVCRHEPFFDWGNPALFGRAIEEALAGKVERIRQRLEKKRRYIERLRGKVYLESSHAFLKSAYLAALDVFPDLRLIHLIRDPVKVAKSEAWREAWRRRVHAPFHYYRGRDGSRYFVWSLTGREEIFQRFDRGRLSDFQRYLIQWIEIENRAMRFLEAHQLHGRCFTLHTPADFKNAARIRSMFEFFGLETFRADPSLKGTKHRNFGWRPVVTPENECEAQEVLERMPASYLRIFLKEPYLESPPFEGLMIPKLNSIQS